MTVQTITIQITTIRFVINNIMTKTSYYNSNPTTQTAKIKITIIQITTVQITTIQITPIPISVIQI